MSELKPVIQEDETGCALACVAMLTQNTYADVKAAADTMSIDVADEALWGSTRPMRQLLAYFDLRCSPEEEPFLHWHDVPDCALLATKHHLEEGEPRWHWCVFQRLSDGSERILDPAASLDENVITDLYSRVPAWFISLRPNQVDYEVENDEGETDG